MLNAEKVVELTRNKTKNVTFTINPELYAKFRLACDKAGIRPIRRIETWIIKMIEEQGLFEEEKSM